MINQFPLNLAATKVVLCCIQRCLILSYLPISNKGTKPMCRVGKDIMFVRQT